MISVYLSDKIKVVSFFCILLVLYIHAGIPNDNLSEGMFIPIIIREIVARIVGDNAVPVFYFISGFLFFLGIDSVNKVFVKIKRRVKSLVVPFILGAIHVPLFYIIIESIPGAGSFINQAPMREVLSELTLPQIFVSLFYDYGPGGPWAFHLWFLRDLIIIILLSPLLYLLIKKLGWLSVIIPVSLFALFPSLNFLFGTIWFLLGHFCLLKLGNLRPQVLFYVFMAFLIITVFHSFTKTDIILWRYLRLIENALGIVVLWNTFDLLVGKDFCLANHKYLQIMCSYTFFIYVYHDPSFHIFVKGIPMLMGYTWYGYLIMFVFTPIFFAMLLVMLGGVLKKYIPNMYFILTGGR